MPRSSNLAIISLALVPLACSDGSGGGGTTGTGTGGTAGATAGAAGGAGGGSAGAGDPGFFPGGSGSGAGGSVTGRCNLTVDRSGCVGELYTGEGIPLDIYVMFDQSGSMAIKDDGRTMRIDAVRSAVDQFLRAPDSRGISVGIGYFGQHPLDCACTSCNPADYARPAVTMGPLPGHANAVMSSLNQIQPTGETPTGPAIRGACMYARGWKQGKPGHQVVILLVTDGEPQAPLTSMKGTCNPTLEDAVAAAAECQMGTPGIKTYVLGIGPSLQNLNRIAQAGGTRQAYLAASGGAQEVLRALNAIRGDAAIPCALQIPMPPAMTTLDHNKVNVVVTDSDCKATTLVSVKDAASCPASGGWYYDDPAKPEKILLCKASCDQVSQPGTQLMFSVGCMTKVIE